MNPRARAMTLLNMPLLSLMLSTQAATAGDLTDAVGRMAKIGSAYSPSFSPDGKQVAFVTDISGIPQIWVVPVEGGWPQRVTALPDQIDSVTWAPQGDLLAF